MIKLNLLLPPHTFAALEQAASRDCLPTPLKALELIEDGIEEEEEELWDSFVSAYEETERSIVRQPLSWS